MSTGFLYDPIFLEHDTGAGHPECSERLVYSLASLEKQNWFSNLNKIASQTAERKWIQAVHGDAYIERAYQSCHSDLGFLDSMDVIICQKSYDIALIATGSLLNLADKVITKEINNGFAMIRPPGHHAEKDQALGFCLFNNVAILARYLQIQHGLDKILILDWDVHHGNGTQHIFEDDPSVLYISTHQYPYYPGTGSVSEDGQGRGIGASLNCPMSAGSGDKEYEQVFIEKILPKIDEFKPELIIISAGFDAHEQDPLAQINLTTHFFSWMTQRVMEKAAQYCEGRIISALEGGYHLEMLAKCIVEHVSVLSDNSITAMYP